MNTYKITRTIVTVTEQFMEVMADDKQVALKVAMEDYAHDASVWSPETVVDVIGEPDWSTEVTQ